MSRRPRRWVLGICFGSLLLGLTAESSAAAPLGPEVEPTCRAPSAPGAGSTLYECQSLTASAQVGGRPPFTFHWTLTQGACLVAESTEAHFHWIAELPEIPGAIFADGFESGDLSAWGSSPTASGKAPAELLLTIAVTNFPVLHSEVAHTDRRSTPITVLPLPALAFQDPPFSAFLHQATLDLTVHDTGTDRRLFFEDPDGLFTDCPPPLARCHRTERTEGTSFQHTWSEAGTYAIVAEIRHCGSPPVLRASTSVTLDSGPQDPPQVLLFDLEPWNSTGCDALCGIFPSCVCAPGAEVSFAVVATDATHLRFDWEGDGVWDETVPPADRVRHTYPLPDTFRPRVQPSRGDTFGEVVELAYAIEIRP